MLRIWGSEGSSNVLIEPAFSALFCESTREMGRNETPIFVPMLGYQLHQELVLLKELCSAATGFGVVGTRVRKRQGHDSFVSARRLDIR